MTKAISSWLKGSLLVVALLAGAVFGWRMQGQSPPSIRVGRVEITTGIPEDWSQHFVVFSDPGTEEEAIQSGRYAEWQSIVNEPRYVLQQLKRNAPVRGPAAGDAEYRSWWISLAAHRKTPPAEFGAEIKTDWTQLLGGPGLAAGHYPAKYSFDPTSADCNDYVVFPTGAAGSGTTQATIVAFTNLYGGGPPARCTGTVPTVKWAYNTGNGAIANLSPVLSLDGTQVAFIQTTSLAANGVASLVILKMPTTNTGTSVIQPTTEFAPSAYSGCTAPCFTTLTLAGSNTNPTNSTTTNVTNSAPFYRYFDDVLYVGDDKGIAHRFSPVFNGTPAETGVPMPMLGWPALVRQGFKLTSPVFDFQPVNTGQPGCVATTPPPVTNVNCEPRVWVGDSNGHINWINTSPPAHDFVNASSQLACTNSTNTTNPTTSQVDVGIVDPALVDVTNGNVYAFVGYGCTSPIGFAAHSGFIGQFSKNNVPGSSELTRANFNGASNPPSSPATFARIGAFDNIFLSGGNGNIYACVDGRVHQAPLPANGVFTTTMANMFSTPVSSVGNTSACSPVTEFLGTLVVTTLTNAIGNNPGSITLNVGSTAGMAVGQYLEINSEIMKITSVNPPVQVTADRGQFGTTVTNHPANTPILDIVDRLFVSVRGNGIGLCTGACVYNYDITVGNATGTPAAGLMVMPPGGSSILASENNSTSGIIVDNQSAMNGAQQIYFSPRASPTSNAVQASQSTLR